MCCSFFLIIVGIIISYLFHSPSRVTEQSEENKMTASNLGIIFGPTLIKPRQADAEVSLSSLVDYPYQALIVELLIRHYQMVFDTPLSPVSGTSPTEVDAQTRANTRLMQQDKEQQLIRHSKSLGDIKEVTGLPTLRYMNDTGCCKCTMIVKSYSVIYIA